MKLVPQLRRQAFDDHPFFLQTVHPGSVQPEGHCRYIHGIFSPLLSCFGCQKNRPCAIARLLIRFLNASEGL